ncbi:MAG: hypothetical protein U9N34_01110, partial [Candidatus Cloacimonadota bacterium]|nr:hypothetical protein [Candidatus Cloacimonadota bacterium]
HSNQDKAFTIMDHLQFQDITAQQIAGAYALLSDTEKTLVYVSEVLREFDDLNKEEQLASNKTINGNSFNADAKFENKKDLQNSIDDLFSSGDLNTEFKQQDQTAEKNKHHISQDDIDKLTKQKKSPVSQDEIDKIANESQNQIKQNDIDDLFNN